MFVTKSLICVQTISIGMLDYLENRLTVVPYISSATKQMWLEYLLFPEYFSDGTNKFTSLMVKQDSVTLGEYASEVINEEWLQYAVFPDQRPIKINAE